MSHIGRQLIVLGVFAVVLGQAVPAADRTLALPKGWDCDDSPGFEVRGDNLAILLRPEEGPPEARILQYRGLSRPVMTTIPGRPWALDYSPNGDYLLVHFIDPTDQDRVALVDAAGPIRWIHDIPETEHYFFSTTGGSILSWNPTRMATGNVGVIFDLEGRRLRQWTFDVSPKGVIAIGDGSRVVITQRNTVECLEAGAGGITTLWRHDLTSAPSPIDDMYPLNRSVAIVRHEIGLRAELIDIVTGAILYTFDAEALAAKDPTRSKLIFQGCVFFSAATARQVVLRCHNDYMAPDLTTGTLTNLMIDSSTPPAMTLTSGMQEGRMVLVGADSLRLRTIE